MWTVPKEKYWHQNHRNNHFWKCYDDCSTWNNILPMIWCWISPFAMGNLSAYVPSELIQTLQLWHRLRFRGSSFSNLTRWVSRFWNSLASNSIRYNSHYKEDVVMKSVAWNGFDMHCVEKTTHQKYVDKIIKTDLGKK